MTTINLTFVCSDEIKTLLFLSEEDKKTHRIYPELYKAETVFYHGTNYVIFHRTDVDVMPEPSGMQFLR